MQIYTSLSPCQREGKGKEIRKTISDHEGILDILGEISVELVGEKDLEESQENKHSYTRRPNADDLRRASARPVKEPCRTRAAGNSSCEF